MRRLLILLALALAAASMSVAPAPAQEPTTPEGPATTVEVRSPGDPFVLAHYYIWFEPTSWNRAKTDFPAIGRYSSDETRVMSEHVRQAKAAGIDGFIVSWKSTEVLDPRLEELITIAEQQDFALAITYQGLDFNRDPLPPQRIIDDLDLFIERYAHRAPFALFDRPLVAWSGTWAYNPTEIDSVTSARRKDLAILATEKNVPDYLRLADHVDGNLYYWSSVNPDTFPRYPSKLVDMATAVRNNDGLWIAPVAPGFDARELGGNTLVDRQDGDVLRAQWNGALESLPDALGIISWNEFSENTHIEPSVEHGTRALEVVADLTGSPAPSAVDFDSSAPVGPPETESGIWRVLALTGLVGVIVVSAVVVRRRSPSRQQSLV